MFPIIGLIPTILTTLTGLGGTASSISKNISDLQIAKVNAASNKEKAQIDAQLAALHDRKDILVAEAGSRINTIVRALIAAGPGLYVFKYFAIDKFLGSLVGCRLDPLPDYCHRFGTDGLNIQMAAVLTAVLAFYFLYRRD